MNIPQQLKCIFILFFCIHSNSLKAQSIFTFNDSINFKDSLYQLKLKEVEISASRISETIFNSANSIDQINFNTAKNFASPTIYDAADQLKGVQIISPSLGFKVINTRGFANTNNVRFTQLVDGADNMAPHIGAPIANAFGACDLDIDKIEIVPGTTSAIYGMNAINGMANIITKNPYSHQGLSLQQLTGINHIGKLDKYNPQLYSQTNFRYAKALNAKFAIKLNATNTKGRDWVADDRTDLATNLNSSLNLIGNINPALDEINSYGNEAPNRRAITLSGKKCFVARTGYRESEIDDYEIENFKTDAGIYFRPKTGHELALSYKGANINNLYQRSNRFRMIDYKLQQYVINYSSDLIIFKTYLTLENTGKTYNIRSLAENMDRAFKTDNKWFDDYKNYYNDAINDGISIEDAHKNARVNSDNGRYIPGTLAYNQKKEELININNWDYGAALKVNAYMSHTDGKIQWEKLNKEFFEKKSLQIHTGLDSRTYIIVPDGNYFINPLDSTKNINYNKSGGFTQINKELFQNKLKLSATLRVDKSDYFNFKLNPRLTLIYCPTLDFAIRSAYQSGYRFPSIFEGFSNVNSGGVKRVGGLKLMSEGVFENSYTKSSIDAFQSQVTKDMNTKGMGQQEAIEKNNYLLQKNPYTYLKPEYVNSFETGVRCLTINKSLYIDIDFYYSIYENFIAQIEASVPHTTNSDSIPLLLLDKSKQSKYRLWTNSKTKTYSQGYSTSLKYQLFDKLSLLGNFSFAKLTRLDNKDGLEDGFNTPKYTTNLTALCENICKKISASITGRFQSKYEYVSFLAVGIVPEYWTIDAQISYSFEEIGLTTKFGATNLLNKGYYNMLGGVLNGGMYYFSIVYCINKL